MTQLDENLSKILQILVEIEEFFLSKQHLDESTFIEGQLRTLNFEANEFFEKLTSEFDISNDALEKIIIKLSDIINILDDSYFEVKITILNLQIFIPIHLLFSLTANPLINQIAQQDVLEGLVSKITPFDSIPKFPKVISLSDKHILDNYLRILGSSGDLYYLLSSNLSVIKKKNLISWSNLCFKQFYLLDLTIEKFDPLEFYSSNHLAVEDFYREIVGYYTILGNTNATNLLEYLLGIEENDLLTKINFKPYIKAPIIDELLNKLQYKVSNINNLLERVEESNANNFYFSNTDNPLDIISFKLMMALEKYFTFTISKIRVYKKEFNQLHTPASTELKNSLSLCEDWLETVLKLTEHNENILDTPFGGLFNSVFLEYLLLLALDDGKTAYDRKDNIFVLEEKLEKYKNIFVEGNHSLEQIADFLYYKTYAQIYLYSCLQDKQSLLDLIDELQSILEFLVNKPLLKLNSLFLILNLELKVRNKSIKDLNYIKNEILLMVSPTYGLDNLKDDVQSYLNILFNKTDDSSTNVDSLAKRREKKILDINSWLLPHFTNKENNYTDEFGFISFNQLGDRIID